VESEESEATPDSYGVVPRDLPEYGVSLKVVLPRRSVGERLDNNKYCTNANWLARDGIS